MTNLRYLRFDVKTASDMIDKFSMCLNRTDKWESVRYLAITEAAREIANHLLEHLPNLTSLNLTHAGRCLTDFLNLAHWHTPKSKG